MRRTAFVPRISVASHVATAKHHQPGGTLLGVQYHTGYFGNLISSLKSVAVPALKAIGKAALPMAQEALAAGLSAKGPIKQRLKAAAQSATKKQNLVALGKAGLHGAMSRPF